MDPTSSAFNKTTSEDVALTQLSSSEKKNVVLGNLSPSQITVINRVNRSLSGQIPFNPTPVAPKAPRKSKERLTPTSSSSPVKLKTLNKVKSAASSSSSFSIRPAELEDTLSLSYAPPPTPKIVDLSKMTRSVSSENLHENVVRRLVWDEKFKQLSQKAKKTKEDLLLERIIIPNDNAFIRLLEKIPGIVQFLVLLGVSSPSKMTEEIAAELIDILHYELSTAVEENKKSGRHESTKMLSMLMTKPDLKRVWEKVCDSDNIKPLIPLFIEKYRDFLIEGLRDPDSKLNTQMLAEDLEKLRPLIKQQDREEVNKALYKALRDPNYWPQPAGEAAELQQQYQALAKDDPLRQRLGILHELCLSTQTYAKKMKGHLAFLKAPKFFDCFGEASITIKNFKENYQRHFDVINVAVEGLFIHVRAQSETHDKIAQIIEKQFNDQAIKTMLESAKELITWSQKIDQLVHKNVEGVLKWWNGLELRHRQTIHFVHDESVVASRSTLDFGTLPFQRLLKFPLFLNRFADEYERENKKIWEQISSLSQSQLEKDPILNTVLDSQENFQDDKLWEEVSEQMGEGVLDSLANLRQQFKANSLLWNKILNAKDRFESHIRKIEAEVEEAN